MWCIVEVSKRSRGAYIREVLEPMQTGMTVFVEFLAWSFGLGIVFLRLWPGLQLMREEQRNPATRFGSKKWHWPALAFLVLLLMVYFALIFSTRTAP
jgi:hypothetical protein